MSPMTPTRARERTEQDATRQARECYEALYGIIGHPDAEYRADLLEPLAGLLDAIERLERATLAPEPSALQGRGEPDGLRGPTEEEIDDACMWYRHDFGLLDESAKEHTRWEAKEWLRAWCKVRDFLPPAAATPSVLPVPVEQGERIAEEVAKLERFDVRADPDDPNALFIDSNPRGHYCFAAPVVAQIRRLASPTPAVPEELRERIAQMVNGEVNESAVIPVPIGPADYDFADRILALLRTPTPSAPAQREP